MKVIMEMQLELVLRVCNYVLEACVRVAPRRPLAMAAELPGSGADCHVCPHATRTIMSETAEPAKERSPKYRKRVREGEEESEGSAQC